MKRRIICALTCLVTVSLMLTACCRQTACKAKLASDNPFNFVPSNCTIIGAVNFKKLCKIETINKQIEANKDTPLTQKFQAAGMGCDNISSICFAMVPSPPAKKGSAQLLPEFIVLLKTEKKIDIKKLIPLVAKEVKEKIPSEKIGTQTIYTMQTDNNQKIVLTLLEDNILAVGSRGIIESAINLKNARGKSIAYNSKLMSLTKNAQRNDMFWAGCTVKEETLATFGKHFPIIKSGFIYGNYQNNKLKVGGEIKCATNQDVQKILIPTQIITGLLLMDPKTGLKPEDIILNAEKNVFKIKLSIPKKVIEDWTQKQIDAISTEKKAPPKNTESEATPNNFNQQG